MEWALVIIVLGVNFTLWTLVGGLRLTTEHLTVKPVDETPGRWGPSSARWPGMLSPVDVAVLIRAHNEAPVIGATIRSALRLVPRENVHVVADSCGDATAGIAQAHGVKVLELEPNRGKAGGIEAAVEHFDIPDRYAVLLIVDADTELDERYLERGLPFFGMPDIVAVAGYAIAGWRPQELSPVGRFLVAYRTRLYAILQWLKYGQTWRWTNVTSIVPGFASMYRTSILHKMDLNPPGLVIEDFNMTFEVHHRRLGKIAFRPAVHATTQDPDNFRDYYRQILRWHLGFWQTLRRHGFWASGFSAALALFLAEVLIASLGLILLVGTLTFVGAIGLANYVCHTLGWVPEVPGLFEACHVLIGLFLFVAALDYLLTLVTALVLRRPTLLLYGLGFIALRLVDAISMLWTIRQAWHTHSDGRWVSPTRRPSQGSSPPVTRGHRS